MRAIRMLRPGVDPRWHRAGLPTSVILSRRERANHGSGSIGGAAVTAERGCVSATRRHALRRRSLRDTTTPSNRVRRRASRRRLARTPLRLRVRRAQRRSPRRWRGDGRTPLGPPATRARRSASRPRPDEAPAGCDGGRNATCRRFSSGSAQRQRCEVPVIAAGTIGAPVSSASLPAPWCGEPTASGASTRVPSGNTTTSPPLDRRARSRSPGHPPHRAASDRSEAEEQPARWAFEQLALGREPHVAAGGDPD